MVFRYLKFALSFVISFQNKCTQYWPDKGKDLDVGPCKMKLLEENVYAFFTFRKFTVQRNNVSNSGCFELKYA